MPITVNGELVEDTAIREEAGRMRGPLADAMPGEDPLAIDMKAWEWAKENIIERILLRQAAGAEGMEALYARLTAKVAAPSSSEIADYYRANPAQFQAPEQIHAAHIVCNVDERVDLATALGAIELAQKELQAGRSFAGVADQHSDCPGNGGDIGWIVRGAMVEEFETVVFKLSVGEVSGVFRTPFGFHIAKLLGRKKAGLRPLKEVHAEIERAIHARRKEEAIEIFADELRARAEIRKVSP